MKNSIKKNKAARMLGVYLHILAASQFRAVSVSSVYFMQYTLVLQYKSDYDVFPAISKNPT